MANRKEYGDIKNYKIVDGGIWIPKEECLRLAEVFKKFESNKSAGNGMMYNTEGFRRLALLYEDFAELIDKGEI